MKLFKLTAVILILMLAAGLRIMRLDAQSFWNDEGNSARLAERSVDTIIEGAGGDIHPPGYYLLLAGWRALAGQSEFALRTLSVFASLLTVAVGIQLGSRLLGPLEGLAGGLLLAINPFQVYYAQEARMYALLALLMAASVLLTAQVLTIPSEMQAGRFRPRRAVMVIGGYVLLNVVGLYTHYTFPLVILAETIVFLIWLVRRSKKVHGLVTWIGLQAVTLLLYLPWLPTAIRQVTTWPSGFDRQLDLSQYVTAWVYGETLSLEVAQVGLIPLFIVVVVGLFGPIEEKDWGGYLIFSERISLILVWCLVLPVGFVFAGITDEAALKFLLPSNAALMLILGRGVVMGIDLGRPTASPGAAQGGWLLLAVLLLVGIALYPITVGLDNLYNNPSFARDDYRAIAERIQAEAGEDAAVVLNAPNQWEVFTYYYPDGPNIAPLPNDQTEMTLNTLLTEQNRIYTLYWGSDQQDPENEVRVMLEQNAFPLGTDWYGGVQLVTYVPVGVDGEQPEVEMQARFSNTAELVGYTLSAETVSPGDAVGVSLYWLTEQPISERLKVFMHIYAFDGALVAQHDSEPGNGLLPTSSWEPGEVLRDNHGALLPSDLPPGDYRVAVGLYQLDGTRLTLPSGEDVLTLQNITVE